MTPIALTIAGSDSGGGAGVQADLKTFLDLGVFGTSAIAAITAQNTRGVRWALALPPEGLVAQVQAVLEDLPPQAVKIGMLANSGLVRAVVAALEGYAGPVVLDPVMVSSNGDLLLEPEAVAALTQELLPRCALVTPNLPELAALGGEAWLARCPVPVLVKGGHRAGPVVEDQLRWPDGRRLYFHHPRVQTRNTHGTGCTLSAAIAALLARGLPLERAVAGGHRYVAGLIARSADHGLGGGVGPLLHGLDHLLRDP